VAWQTVLVITATLTCAHAVIMPRWRFRVHRWEVSESGNDHFALGVVRRRER
jgi:membrane protein YdbS with pleckstrin-like domain